MRPIIVLFLVLGIAAFAVIGGLYIFEVRNGEEALDLLLKTEGAIVLLGGCAIAVSLLTGSASDKSKG